MAVAPRRKPPKPGPNYFWNGRDWVWIQKRQPPAKPKTTPAGPKAPPARPQTMEEWATQQAEKRVQAEVEAIRAQQAAYEAEMQRNAQAMMDRAKGLSEYMQAQGIDQKIRGIYSGAANDLAGIAGGFSGEMRDVASADAAAQRNMLSGTGQEDSVRDQGGNMGDVVYGVGGWIPSKSLGEQGAAYAADAAMQPAFTLQYGQQGAMDYLREGQSGLSDFATAIAEVQAGKYSYKEELLSQRREAALAQQKLNLDRLDEERDFWLKKQALYLSQGKLKLAKQAEKRASQAQKRYDFESQGRDSEGNPMPGYTVNPKTGTLIPPGYKVDKHGNVVKQYAPKSGSGSKDKPKYTPSQQISIMESVVGSKESIQDELVKAVRAGEWTPSSGDPKARAALGRKLFKEFQHLAGTYQPALKRLRQMIANLLREATVMGPPAPGSARPSGGSTSAGDAFWDPAP
jgi:hypothetical protein